MKSIVAILGRPNVGKSTLFNRITKKRDALVDDMPGVTRDRHYGDAEWDDVKFTLIDTGGFSEKDQDGFSGDIRNQIDYAIDDADVVLLILDGKRGISPYDQEIAEFLRSVDKPILCAVNKIDGIAQEIQMYDFFDLGVETLYPISAEHGYGISDFLTALVSELPKQPAELDTDMDQEIRMAVIGRPNVGKSSLVNCILGENRQVVSPLPGTTRGAIDSVCQINNKAYRLIDTAGIRRKGRVHRRLEKFSVIKALKSLERCDIALVMIDASEGITDQDIKIAGYAFERGRGLILILNKWDLVQNGAKSAKKFREELQLAAKYLSFVPVLSISARTGRRVPNIFKQVDQVYCQYASRISTGLLNNIFEKATLKNEPSLYRGRRIKFYYATQATTKPPTIISFVNYPKAVHFSYHRYLINQIRKGAGLDKTPVRLIFRPRTGRSRHGPV
jgi:GTP-binding protein